jgi:hypothetical protein
MPSQEEHDKPENLVESPHQKVRPAQSLPEEVDSNATLEGYYAMNNVKNPAELEKEAAATPDDPRREKGHPIP